MPIVADSAMKYILVTGGVISGVGKGIIASSLGVILKYHGLNVSAIKIDPYINIDAGTFSPYEHGEVFVLDDGGEVDLDLGNYERFMGLRLKRDNNITTGKIYQSVIEKERRGDYLGKTVQVVPHVTDEIQNWVNRVAHNPVDGTSGKPDICIIELGGTIGDIEGMPFIEAFRAMLCRVGRENFLNVHVTLVVEPQSTGEQKTKPTQNSVKELGRCGLHADLLICRSNSPLDFNIRRKIGDSCNVRQSCVVNVPDVQSIYDVPLVLDQQDVLQTVVDQLSLKLPNKSPGLAKWRQLAYRFDHLTDEVNIALVGKYVHFVQGKPFTDAYTSVIKALKHAAAACNKKLKLQLIRSEALEEQSMRNCQSEYTDAWEKLGTCDGVIVPGGFGERGIEGKITACRWARKNNKPFLGVCLGMQCAVIDFARDVARLAGAHSIEFDPETSYPVIIDMPEHNQGQMGGTMRLGLRSTIFNRDTSLLRKLYGGKSHIDERHRHRFEVNPKYVPVLESGGLHFVGHGDPERNTEDSQRMEIVELEGHPYYVGVQFHPEYTSQPLMPSPPYFGLILAATGHLAEFMKQERVPSPLTVVNGSIEGLGNASCNGVYKSSSAAANHRSSPITIRRNATSTGLCNGGPGGWITNGYHRDHHNQPPSRGEYDAQKYNGLLVNGKTDSSEILSTSV